MDCLFDIGSTIFIFMTGNVFDNVTFTKPQIVCMDVDNRLDAFVFVVIAGLLFVKGRYKNFSSASRL
jgi:hypothetical protein